MTIEGHERCIPQEHYQKLQELFENQKKLLAKLQKEAEEQAAEITRLNNDLNQWRTNYYDCIDELAVKKSQEY